MSTAEILAELPKLSPDDRQQVYQRLCELQERDLVTGTGPTPEEKNLLDDELAEYEKDGDRGQAWDDVLQELRARKAS